MDRLFSMVKELFSFLFNNFEFLWKKIKELIQPINCIMIQMGFV